MSTAEYQKAWRAKHGQGGPDWEITTTNGEFVSGHTTEEAAYAALAELPYLPTGGYIVTNTR